MDIIAPFWGIENCLFLIISESPRLSSEEIGNEKEGASQWGRYLGYVWLDGKLVNVLLVEEGFAIPAEYPPDTKYAQEIKAASHK